MRRYRLPLVAAVATVVLAGLAFVLLAAPVAEEGQHDAAQWAAYKQRFVTAEGRVIDTGNASITHSEGQGWGMLFAETFDDRETFDRIWGWTSRSLQWQGSRLFAWKWVPGSGDPVPDPNNATDGDMLIAWALERASRRWNQPAYADAAKAIAADIRRLLVAKDKGRPVLLPAFDGFDEGGRITVNLSYYVFPAFAALERLDPSPQWAELRRAGMALLGQARFGRWGLPADWMNIEPTGKVAPASRWPARFGYDAVRIPLYLIWSGVASPEILEPYRTFWSQFGDDANVPGWAALDGDAYAPYTGSAGLRAIARLVAAQKPSGEKSVRPELPEIGERDDYYSASLILLTRVAVREAALATL